jgi:hypothetical protein
MFVLGFRLWFRRVGCLEGKSGGLREVGCNNARIQRSECFEGMEKMRGKNGKLGWEKWRESYRELRNEPSRVVGTTYDDISLAGVR